MPVKAADDAADAAELELLEMIPDTEEGLPVAERPTSAPAKLAPIEDSSASATPTPAKAPEQKPVVQDSPRADGRREDGTFAPKAAEAPEPIATAPAEPAEPEVTDEPWSFDAYGSQLAIPGARIKPGVGAFIPESSLMDARRLMARGTLYDKLNSERAQLRDGVTRKQLEASTTAELVAPLLTVDGLREAGQNPELFLARLQARIAVAQRDIETKYAGKILPDDLLTSEDSGDIHMQRQDAIEAGFMQAVSQPEMAKMLKGAPQLRKHLQDRTQRFQGQFFVPAPHDGNGYKKGQTVFDAGGFSQFLREEAELYVKAHPSAAKSAPPSAPSSSAKPLASVNAPPSGGNKVTPSASAPPNKPSDDRRNPKAKQPWRARLNSEFDDILKNMGND